MAWRPCAPRTSDSSLAALERARACGAGRSPDAATSRPSCREPRDPRRRTPRTQTGSHAENLRTNRADHPRPQTRCASPSTATATQAPTGKDRCLASPHDRLDPNQSLPTQTQKAALPTQFSEEPTGYTYATGAGNPNFASIVLPAIQTASYTVLFLSNGVQETATVAPNTVFTFPPGGVSTFTVT